MKRKPTVDELVELHFKCKSFLDIKDFDGFKMFLHPIIENNDPNELKTILIITKAFKEWPEFKETRLIIKNQLEEQVGPLK
jgi:hypothetical protein